MLVAAVAQLQMDYVWAAMGTVLTVYSINAETAGLMATQFTGVVVLACINSPDLFFKPFASLGLLTCMLPMLSCKFHAELHFARPKVTALPELRMPLSCECSTCLRSSALSCQVLCRQTFRLHGSIRPVVDPSVVRTKIPVGSTQTKVSIRAGTMSDASNADIGQASIILGQEQFLGQAPTSEKSEEAELRLRLRLLGCRKRCVQAIHRSLQQLDTLLRAKEF